MDRPLPAAPADSLESFARRALAALEDALTRDGPCPDGDACPDCSVVRAARACRDAGLVPEAALLVLLSANLGQHDTKTGTGMAAAVAGLATTPRGLPLAHAFGLFSGQPDPEAEAAPVVPDGRTRRLGSASNPVVFDAEKVACELLRRMRKVKPAIDAAMPMDPWDDPTELAVRCAEQYLDGGMPEKALLVGEPKSQRSTSRVRP